MKQMYIVAHGFKLDRFGRGGDEYYDLETINWNESLEEFRRIKFKYCSAGEYVYLSKVQIDDNGECDYSTFEEIYRSEH